MHNPDSNPPQLVGYIQDTTGNFRGHINFVMCNECDPLSIRRFIFAASELFGFGSPHYWFQPLRAGGFSCAVRRFLEVGDITLIPDSMLEEDEKYGV